MNVYIGPLTYNPVQELLLFWITQETATGIIVLQGKHYWLGINTNSITKIVLKRHLHHRQYVM